MIQTIIRLGVSMKMNRLAREKLMYVRHLVDREALLVKMDLHQNKGRSSEIVEEIRRLDGILSSQRKLVAQSGGNVIDTALLKLLSNSYSLQDPESVSLVRSALDEAFPHTTEYKVEAFNDSEVELSVFTDRRLIAPVTKVINEATEGAAGLNPFESARINDNCCRIFGLDTLEDALSFVNSFKSDFSSDLMGPGL